MRWMNRAKLSVTVAMMAFAIGCAAAAILYDAVGFWCLAVPVLVGAVSAVVRIED